MDPATLATAALLGASAYAVLTVARPECLLRPAVPGAPRRFKSFGPKFTSDTSPVTPASVGAAVAIGFVAVKWAMSARANAAGATAAASVAALPVATSASFMRPVYAPGQTGTFVQDEMDSFAQSSVSDGESFDDDYGSESDLSGDDGMSDVLSDD